MLVNTLSNLIVKCYQNRLFWI